MNSPAHQMDRDDPTLSLTMSSDDELTDESGPCDSDQQISWPPGAFERVYCFFYGTLMDPQILARALGMSDCPPILRPAKVVGYDIKLWRPFPALVNKPRNTVTGMACEIMSRTQLDRLVFYETDKYALRPCIIYLLNDKKEVETKINGVTFMWNGEEEELEEGKFDLKQWKRDKRLRELDTFLD